MPSLQVRDVPEPLFRKLKEVAERDHRSLAQEAVAILEKGLEIEKSPKNRRRELLKKACSMNSATNTKQLKSPADLIREDRGR